jgi:hypothetical protein
MSYVFNYQVQVRRFNSGFYIRQRQEIFTPQNFHPGSRSPRGSYSIDVGGSAPGVKRLERKDDQSPPSGAEVTSEDPRLLPYTHSRRAEGIDGEKRYSSTHLVLGTRWTWVVNYMPQALYPPVQEPRFALNRPQNPSGHLKKQLHFSLHAFILTQAKQTGVNAAVNILLTLRQVAAAWRQLIKLPHSTNDSYKQRCSNTEGGGGPRDYFPNVFFVTIHTQRPRCSVAADAPREAMYVKRTKEASSCNHCCNGKAVSHNLSVYF